MSQYEPHVALRGTHGHVTSCSQHRNISPRSCYVLHCYRCEIVEHAFYSCRPVDCDEGSDGLFMSSYLGLGHTWFRHGLVPTCQQQLARQELLDGIRGTCFWLQGPMLRLVLRNSAWTPAKLRDRPALCDCFTKALVKPLEPMMRSGSRPLGGRGRSSFYTD